jgi:hypothetical protein
MSTDRINNAWIQDELVHLSRDVKILGDAELTLNTKLECWKFHTGVMRIPFYGMTGSGKSTAINAILGKITLPENPNVATPIEVGIGYNLNETPLAVVAAWDGDRISTQEKDVRSFLREFCYNDGDPEKQNRYSGVIGGNIYLKSSLLTGNISIVDTLGINASRSDDDKTIKTLRRGSEIAVFVNSGYVLLDAEAAFIRNYLFGIGPVRVPYPIRPENLLLLHNDRTGVEFLEEGFKKTVEKIFEYDKTNPNGIGQFSPETVREFLRNNVLFSDMLDARLQSAGIFPYLECEPTGSSSFYEKDCAKLLKLERRRFTLLPESDSGEPLRRWLLQKTEQLRSRVGSFGSVAAGQLISVFRGVRERAEAATLLQRGGEHPLSYFRFSDEMRQTILLAEYCKKIEKQLKNS